MDAQRETADSVFPTRCPECRGSALMYDRECAEVVCTHCGFVITTNQLSGEPEWRAFTREQAEQKIRVGAPSTFTIHDKGLSTKIDWRDIPSLPSKQRAQFLRLVRWQQRGRIATATERNTAEALAEMHRLVDPLNLPENTLTTAAIIYRTARKKRLIRGRNIQEMAVAAVYLACRQCGLTRPLRDLAHASHLDKKTIAANYRHLVTNLGYSVPPVEARGHITRLSSALVFQGHTEKIAHRILNEAKRRRLTFGRDPRGLAAAASYIAAMIMGEPRTQREIAETMDVTEVTIRNRYKEIMNQLRITLSL